MKPLGSGHRTTEFWLVLILVLTASVASLLEVARGTLDAPGAIALVSAALATATYAHGRAALKRSAP